MACATCCNATIGERRYPPGGLVVEQGLLSLHGQSAEPHITQLTQSAHAGDSIIAVKGTISWQVVHLLHVEECFSVTSTCLHPNGTNCTGLTVPISYFSCHMLHLWMSCCLWQPARQADSEALLCPCRSTALSL